MVLIEGIERIGREVFIRWDIVVTHDTIGSTEFEEGNDVLTFHEVLVGNKPACSHRGEVTYTMLWSKNRTCLCAVGSGNEIALVPVVRSLDESSPALTRHDITAVGKRRRRVKGVHTARHAYTGSGGVFGLPETILKSRHSVEGVLVPLVTTLQYIGSTERFAHTNVLAYVAVRIRSVVGTGVDKGRTQPVTGTEGVGSREMEPIREMEVQLEYTREIEVIRFGVVVFGTME